MAVHITFDPTRNALNVSKHGVSLRQAADLEWDTAVVWTDARRDYGEPRECGIGYIGLRLFFVVFVDRGGERRVISLRKANLREVKRYAET